MRDQSDFGLLGNQVCLITKQLRRGKIILSINIEGISQAKREEKLLETLAKSKHLIHTKALSHTHKTLITLYYSSFH